MRITVNGVEYSDETEAKKAIAQARREERKQAERDEINAIQARHFGEHSFYRLVHYCDKLVNDHGTTDWVTVEAESASTDAGRSFTLRISTPVGSDTFDFIGWRPLRTLEAADGTIAVLLVDCDNCNRFDWLIPAVYNNRKVLIPIPEFLWAYLREIPEYESK